MPDMPSYRAVMEWLENYPAFARKYARARDIQTDLIAEEILDISDDSSRDWVTDQDGNRVVDHDHISRTRLRVDSRKWMAGKLKPKKYGEKVLHTGGDGEGPIAVKTTHDWSLLSLAKQAQLIALIEEVEALEAAAKQRLAAIEAPESEDGE